MLKVGWGIPQLFAVGVMVAGCGEVTTQETPEESNLTAAVPVEGISQALCAVDTDCNDNDVCTTDTCKSNGSCQHGANAGVACDDGTTCTTNDVCKSNKSCAGTPVTNGTS